MVRTESLHADPLLLISYLDARGITLDSAHRTICHACSLHPGGASLAEISRHFATTHGTPEDPAILGDLVSLAAVRGLLQPTPAGRWTPTPRPRRIRALIEADEDAWGKVRPLLHCAEVLE